MQQTHFLKTISAEEGRVGGYLVVWGAPHQRDLQGEYFTPHTELGLDWYPVRPVLFHHGLAATGAETASVIGTMDHLHADEQGVWAEAVLDAHHAYYEAFCRMINDGVLAWSSGSLPHLVRVGDDGQIIRWIIVEGSLTPRPAEPRRTDVYTLKSAYDALGLDAARLNLPENLITLTSTSDTQGEIMNENIANPTAQNSTESITPRKRLPMASAEDAAPNGYGVRGMTVSSPFDTMEAADLLHGYMMLRSLKSFQGVSERYANALAHKIGRERLSAIKSDELSHTAQAGYGDEWVADLWSDTIWQRARMENTLLPLFRSVDMPSNPFELPVDGTDPQVYYVPETRHESQLTLGSGSAIPDSKIGSGKVQLEAKKLALRVGFTSELIEDSIVPLLNIYREQAARAIADSIDHVLLNGDTVTTATTNINHIAGTPTGSERYLAFDGLRKLPLVTSTALKVNMAAAPTLAKLRETRFKLPAKAAARPSELAWIVDPNTYAALLSLPEFLTMDKAGSLATAQTGQIGFIDGIPVFVSAEMALSDANGMVSAASGGTKGSALCVYRAGWFVGYRRKLSVNVEYLTYHDSYQLTATVRLAFARAETNAASLLYNITV